MDSHWRSAFKSLTYRLAGALVTTLVAWWATRRLDVAASIGLLDTLSKLLLYYLHERAWQRVLRGSAGPGGGAR